ncbi:MAG: phosphatidylserine decarboxylase family protein [Marinilabiliales bacterium]|nr:MAG: phosphatidylserine decarboxylase family protein [Marinilabiliales bacterium]
MKIHKEGYKILITLLGILTAANILIWLLLEPGSLLLRVFLAVSVAFLLFVLWFFRLPGRDMELNDNLVIAPADGKIVAIEETDENEFFNDKRLQVSIFMSPLNVHVNLFPITGTVSYFKYHPGKYLVAWHPKASSANERSSVVVDNGSHAVLVRQIAGVLARRIVCYARPGEKVDQGQELGFIKFGSRVDLFLPTDIKLNVQIGQKVNGKSSVIASFN